MNIKERNEKLAVFFEACEKILEKKGIDYNPDGIAFSEIYGEAAALGLRPESYMGVLMSKHWGAIKSYINTGKAASEPIHERLKDLANYCAMMSVMIEEEKK